MSQEHLLIVPTSLKPLYLLHLLYGTSTTPETASQSGSEGVPIPLRGGVLIFTKSVESSARLVKLVHLFAQEFESREGRAASVGERKGVKVAECSSEISSGERQRILASFKRGQLDV